MKSYSILLIIIVMCNLIGCKFAVDSKSRGTSMANSDSNKCNIYNQDHIFQNDFFPFDFKDYRANDLLKYFNSDVLIDSIEYNNDGFISRTYKFSDNKSYIKLFVKINDKSDSWYYLESSKIISDILRFKNGIKIGMSKVDFYNAINFKVQKCDTFLIQEGDMVTSFYFVFKCDKLNLIDIITPEKE